MYVQYVTSALALQVSSRLPSYSAYKCNVVAERSSALDPSSGVIRMWVRIPARLVGHGACLLGQDT